MIVPVPLGERRYEVRVGAFAPDEAAAALAAALGSKTTGVAVLVDGRVARVQPRAQALVAALAQRMPRVQTYPLPPGESAKTLSALEATCQWLAEQGYDRGAAIVGIGGGAASDHAGFAAAIYLRGVAFALCPTTLLAMVDASVGGKTAVDLPAGKNLVGAFHQPSVVVADLGFLDTLGARERAAGMAEVVKAGLVADAALVDTIERHEAGLSAAALTEVIAAAVRIKAEIVVADERAGGRRAILNFGHTVGHALEASSGYGLLHGEAVALGMVAALEIGRARGVTDATLVPRVSALLARLGLPVDVKPRLDPATVARIAVDKKRTSENIRFVLVPRPGRALIQEIPLPELKAALAAL